MGTLLREGGLRYELRFREGNHERPHVHVHKRGVPPASIALDGEVLVPGGLPTADLAQACNTVGRYREVWSAMWRRIHGQETHI
ncbi:MAG: DUF4160 domain-containing protein [Candidatus Sericytochromatia bacterium]|nr:DUF4160 domain-containing protein [Candidatus Tanganyikabacteria bacterium]